MVGSVEQTDTVKFAQQEHIELKGIYDFCIPYLKGWTTEGNGTVTLDECIGTTISLNLLKALVFSPVNMMKTH